MITVNYKALHIFSKKRVLLAPFCMLGLSGPLNENALFFALYSYIVIYICVC